MEGSLNGRSIQYVKIFWPAAIPFNAVGLSAYWQKSEDEIHGKFKRKQESSIPTICMFPADAVFGKKAFFHDLSILNTIAYVLNTLHEFTSSQDISDLICKMLSCHASHIHKCFKSEHPHIDHEDRYKNFKWKITNMNPLQGVQGRCIIQKVYKCHAFIHMSVINNIWKVFF